MYTDPLKIVCDPRIGLRKLFGTLAFHLPLRRGRLDHFVDLFKPLLHVETFCWNLCATTLRNKFQQALHRVNLLGNVETGLKMLFYWLVYVA